MTLQQESRVITQSSLTPADLDRHRQLGIDLALLERQQVRRVDDRHARDVLGVHSKPGDYAGIEYPYLDPHTGRRVTSRIRRDRPEMENGKPKAKYVSPFGDRRHLYIVVSDVSHLADTRIPVIWVEAEKSGLSIGSVAARQARPLVAIGTGGCWGWRGRIGKTDTATGERVDEVGVLPDVDRLAWLDRVVYLALDANAATNQTVQAARRALAREMLTRKARVRIVALPVEDGLNGPDDFIGRHGDLAWLQLLDAATTADVGVTLDDFRAYMPTHTYIFMPARELWPAASVDARITDWPTWTTKTGEEKVMAPSAWLDRHQAVEQMTWCPGRPEVIEDTLIADGGWIPRPGCATVNVYRPPRVAPGHPEQAEPWLAHLRRIYPHDAAHVLGWCAHRVQHPDAKVNHALVLGGPQGIGKDTLLEPLKYAVGPWNFAEILPEQLLARFNSFVRSVVLRINEAKDQGEIDRFALYERLKIYCAAPPDVIRCDEKHLREHNVLNVTSVIITTNYKTDGIYLPADDRRHYVAWSDLTKDDFAPAYWDDLWAWYADGGLAHVAAFLQTADLSAFHAKAPPPKTEAWWAIVQANQASEDADFADVLDRLKHPEVVTLRHLIDLADSPFADFLRDRRNARRISHRLEAVGYVPVRNDAAKDGLWPLNGKRQAIYGTTALTFRDRVVAAHKLAGW